MLGFQRAARTAARLHCRHASRPYPNLPAVSAVQQRQKTHSFHAAARLHAVQPYMLADIGEGITECQIVQWLVKPGDQVDQFDPICEVQSDKASVEITSRFEGRIEKLHYDVGEMAIVGAPLVDIDVHEGDGQQPTEPSPLSATATQPEPTVAPPAPEPAAAAARPAASLPGDQVLPLTPIQQQMFQTMTRSLAIPHFLFTHKVDLMALQALRRRLNADINSDADTRLSVLPFVLKALSAAAAQVPAINAHVNARDATVTLRAAHHFGVAVDTPQGLVVPVVRDVQDHTVRSLAAAVAQLGARARAGRLRPADLQGASLVVSNVGSLGGGAAAVAPVIVAPMAAIVAVGAVDEAVPAFRTDAQGRETVVKTAQVVLSWSADHRVLDGATVARCAQLVAAWLENVDESQIGR